MRFSNILLILDSHSGHSLALRRAITLAKSEFATLTICDVVERIPVSLHRSLTMVTPQEVMDSLVAERVKRIHTAIESSETKGIPIKVTVLVGKPHLEIAKQVVSNHHDLVIKSITGTKPNSVEKSDRELMRICPCPVWLVNDADQSKDQIILAALDMPVDGGVSAGMNEHILEAARSIALADFRRLHVVHAWYLVEESHMKARGGEAARLELDRMQLGEAARRMNWLEKTVIASKSESERIANEYLKPELHVIKGQPETVIPSLAGELGAGLIVMGSAARTGLSGVWLGNTSERILSRSDSSLLIVKMPPVAAGTPALKNAERTHHDFQGSMEQMRCVNGSRE
jgi:nucleotide-binding universal stress UspA family protein